MKNYKSNPLLKNGVWIKEQQGYLTIGSLDESENEVMVIPDELSAQILEFEEAMIDAIYGDNKKVFDPEVVDIERLLSQIKNRFKDKKIFITFDKSTEEPFKGNYGALYDVMEKFVMSSLSDASQEEPLIYIKASFLQGHLCIVYRDSGSISTPSKLKDQIQFIEKNLTGEISYKKNSGDKSYFDIVIPSL